MSGSGPVHSPSALRVTAFLLLGAQTLFLWMYFAAENVPQAVVGGQACGPADAHLALVAARFAAQWKHGMAGNSPIYMPGFFAVGLLTWLWSIDRPLPRLAAEWAVLVAAAAVLAAGLAPIGGVQALRAFNRVSGLTCAGVASGVTFASATVSLYTIFTWCTGVVCVQRSIARRSFTPMAVPIVLNVVLLSIRPWAVNDYTTQWFADVSRGRPVAVVSLVAVPVLVALLVLYQLRTEGVGPARRRADGDHGPCGPFPTR